MKMNEKTGARAKILAYVARNGLSTIDEIMAGTEETTRIRAANNVRAAVNDGLLKMKRDDVTNLPAYEITPEGKKWLSTKGKGKAESVEPEEPQAPEKPEAAMVPAVHQAPEPLVSRDTVELMGVLADIRKAIGDDTGRIMLGDLAAYIKNERNSLLSDRRDFLAHLDVIAPMAVELLPGYGAAISSAKAMQVMGMLVDAQHAHIQAQAAEIKNQEQQITELRARVEAQILAGHESASSANRLLTEVHEVLAKGWPAGLQAPTGRTTVQLAQAMAQAFGELYVEHMAGLNITPDAYLVTRNDDRGVTRHKSPDAAQRKAKAVVRAGATLATVYAVTRVAKAIRGPVIETR